MVVADYYAIFTETADDDLNVRMIYAGDFGDLFRGTRGVNNAPQDMIAGVSVLPGTFRLFPGAHIQSARHHHSHRLSNRDGIPAVVYRGFQAAFAAPHGDAIHHLLFAPAGPDQKESYAGFVLGR